MARTRYIEKSTGKWYCRTGWSSGPNGGVVMLRDYDDVEGSARIDVPDSEVEERFEVRPWDKPVMKVEDIVPRHPIRIMLYCPECGGLLENDGSAYLTSPLQYEHTCSNPDCRYEVCTRSYCSGMYCLVTDEQERKLNDGTFDENKDGRLIRVNEDELWKFK